MTNDFTDYEEFEELARQVRDAARPLLEHFFGKQCTTFVEECEACRRWKLLDELLENPFEEDE